MLSHTGAGQCKHLGRSGVEGHFQYCRMKNHPLWVNECLRDGDMKRGEPQEIFACRGEGHGQRRVTMIAPPPTAATLVKLKKEEHRFSFHLFFFLFNYITLITIILQNLGGREGRA